MMRLLPFLAMVFWACHKDDPIIVPVIDPPVTQVDHFSILPSSSNYLSCYHGKDSLVFEDSLGKVLILRVKTFLNRTTTVTVSSGDSVTYVYKKTGDFISMADDSFRFLFNLDLEPKLYIPDSARDSIKSLDGLTIIFGHSSSFPYMYDVFHKIIDLRDYNNSVNYYYLLNILEPSRTFLGNTFFEVEHTPPFNNSDAIVYFNKTYGIVAFSDLDHNLWRLKL